jgi:hypothetical protein
MKIAKKLTIVGCTLILGYALIKWLASPRLVEVNLPLSESLPGRDYIVGHSNSSERVRIMNGKVYAFE